MRIIFLDIDGVLNSGRYFKTRGKPKPVGSVLEHHGHDLSIDLIENLEALVLLAPADTRIVLSSTWRVFFDLDEMHRLINQRIKDERNRDSLIYRWMFIDKTPRGLPGQKFSEHIIRGREIKWWLDNTDEDVTHYVILDDDGDMTEEQKRNHFVKTPFSNGLTAQHVMKAVKILYG